MLTPAPSTTLNLADQFVYFPADPVAVVRLMARLVLARDPYGPAPFAALRILEIGANPLGDGTMSEVLTYFTNPANLARTTADTLKNLDQTGMPVQPLYTLANWLGTGDAVKLLSEFWLRDGSTGTAPPPIRFGELDDHPASLNASAGSYLGGLAEMGLPPADKPRWLTDEEQNALAAVTLFASFHRIINDTMFTGAITIESGANRALVPVAERLVNLVALVTALRDGISIMALREKWRFLESAPLKRLQQYVSPAMREEYTTYASYVQSLKVHPWLAEAERLLIPAPRQTIWGTATPSQGLVSLWETVKSYAAVKDNGTPAGGVRRIEELVTPSYPDGGGTLQDFITEARALKRRRERFAPGLLERCEVLLGYGTPSATVPVHLFGDTWKAVTRTGYAADTAVTDWPQLMLLPNIPLETASGENMTWGPTRAYTYDAAVWQSGGAATNPDGSPVNAGPGSAMMERALYENGGTLIPLYVSPQERAFKAGFGVVMIPPEALQPFVNTEYFGDFDKQFWPYTMDGAAQAMGYTNAGEMLTRLNGVNTRLAHIFQLRAGVWTKPDKYKDVTHLFTSTRTRETWRRPVLVEPAIPTQQMALDMRSMPHAPQPVTATVFRTMDKPTAAADMLSFADALATKALNGIGQ